MELYKIGWIGTGHMGNPMCKNLIKAGLTVSVNTRTKAKASDLIQLGANYIDDLIDLIRKSDVLFTSVCNETDVESIFYSTTGILNNAKLNSIWIDTTTSSPSLAKKIYEDAKQKKIYTLDAPVSGGPFGAKDGTLAIMIGGDKKTLEKVNPILKFLGKKIKWMGSAGSGQKAKLCNQILLVGTMAGIVESLFFAYKNGLNQNEVVEVLNSGVNASPMVENQASKIANNDNTPGISTINFLKDIELVIKETDLLNIKLPTVSLLKKFYVIAKNEGLGNLGANTSLYEVLKKINTK